MSNASFKLDLAAGMVFTAALGFLLSEPSPSVAGPVLAGVFAYLLLASLLARFHPEHRPLGWANRITLARAVITCTLAGALLRPTVFVDQAYLVTSLVLLALALDGFDGWLARRLGETSEFGARFDMETDAAMILVLCCALWLSGLAPAWVLVIGLLRPAFVLAGFAFPWLARPLPVRFRRKLVCVIVIVVLPVALLPPLSAALRLTLLAGALLALVSSFAADAAWLFRNRRASSHPQWRIP